MSRFVFRKHCSLFRDCCWDVKGRRGLFLAWVSSREESDNNGQSKRFSASAVSLRLLSANAGTLEFDAVCSSHVVDQRGCGGA